MKKLLVLIIISGSITLSSAQNGEKNFKTICASCHTIGKGRLVGPDLKNVHTKYEEAWLLKWISSSQTMVKAGDEKAVAIFKEFGGVPMPDNPQFSEADIKEIVAYVKAESEKAPVSAAAPAAQQPAQATGADSAIKGQKGSGNTFLYIGIGIVIVFFLAVLAILARSVTVLSNELKNIRNEKKN